MIRPAVRARLLAFAVITAVGIAYVGARYVGFGIFQDRYTVTAEFTESGGIFSGAEVTYRGVTVGEVGDLHLLRDGVAVDLDIDRGHRIPADTKAVVANRSAVGEQYVDLQPRTSDGPYLSSGSRIPREDTETPVQTTTVLLNLDRLVNSVDKEELTVVIDELGKAFAGTGQDLGRLIDSGNALVETANENLPETIDLIEDAETVLRTQNETGGAIKSFARDLALLSGQLRESDPDLRQVLDRGVTASEELETLLRDVEPTLPVLLGNLVTVGEINVVRLPAWEQILVTYPLTVAGAFTVAPGDGTAHFGLTLNVNDPPPCTSGYGGTDTRVPQDTDESIPPNTDARCAEPRGSETSVRGSQNAPSPGTSGSGERPGSGSGSTEAGDPAEESLPGGAPPVYIAGYDPVTGLVVGPDGRRIIVGSQGGQQRLFGEDSWKWLLISPLTGS